MRTLSKKTVAMTAAVFTIAGAGVAFAYWTETGSGTGSATTDKTQPVTVNQVSKVAGLYPGGPALALSGTFTNPNPGKVRVGEVFATVTGTSDPGCTAADFAVEGSAAVNAEVDPGTVGTWSGLTIRMVDDTTRSQDACKNVTVDLSYVVK